MTPDGWLVVVDLQRVFGDPASPWAAPRFGAVRPLILLALGTVLGWGLVTNTYASWLSWQGYLLDVVGLGGKEGAWAFANLGVLLAFVVGLVGTYVLRRSAVRAQEQLPV